MKRRTVVRSRAGLSTRSRPTGAGTLGAGPRAPEPQAAISGQPSVPTATTTPYRQRASPPSSSRPKGPIRLVVLPLESANLDPRDGYLADGLTEELVSVLSQVRGLRVISTSSAGGSAGAGKAIVQVGKALGAASVLEGSVRRVVDRLRVSVRLTDSQTDAAPWEKTIDDTLGRVLTVRGELAEGVVGALNVHLSAVTRDAFHDRPTSSLAAYDAYLRGIQEYRRMLLEGRESQKAVREAWSDFETAIQRDPQFAEAYAYLANHLLGAAEDALPAKEVIARIRELVAKALELAPHLPDAHTAQGNLAAQADHDWRRAEVEFRRAIVLNPSSAVTHFWYGSSLSFFLQRHEQATKEFRTAIELDPLWLYPRLNLIWTHVDAGHLASAMSECETTAQLFPDSAAVRVALAWCYALANRDREALKQVETVAASRALSVFRNPIAVLAYLGRTEDARSLLADWEANHLEGYFPPTNVAAFYALVGDGDTALCLLEQKLREDGFLFLGDYQGAWYDSIRADPRFVSLLRRLDLPTTLSRPLTPGYDRSNGRSGGRKSSLRQNADRGVAFPDSSAR